MKIQSKANEISQCVMRYNSKSISYDECKAAIASILTKPYRLYDNGIEHTEEMQLLLNLVQTKVIKQTDAAVQIATLERMSMPQGAATYQANQMPPVAPICPAVPIKKPITKSVVFWVLLCLGIFIVFIAIMAAIGANYNARITERNQPFVDEMTDIIEDAIGEASEDEVTLIQDETVAVEAGTIQLFETSEGTYSAYCTFDGKNIEDEARFWMLLILAFGSYLADDGFILTGYSGDDMLLFSVKNDETIMNEAPTPFKDIVSNLVEGDMYFFNDITDQDGLDKLEIAFNSFEGYDGKTFPFESLRGNATTELPDPIMMFDENGIQISYVGFDEYGSLGPEFKLHIENNSDVPITVQAWDSSIDGIMVDGMMSCDVMPGKVANTSLTFLSRRLEENGIETIGSVDLKFHIFNSDTWDTIVESSTITLENYAAGGE